MNFKFSIMHVEKQKSIKLGKEQILSVADSEGDSLGRP